ncbi:MaoC family dehydratase, partial [Gordonia hydrophobica]
MPRTRTGKTMRRLLRDVAADGEPHGDTSAVEDTAVLDQIVTQVNNTRSTSKGHHDDYPTTGHQNVVRATRAGTGCAHAVRRTATETDSILFTTMTMNPALLHLDADYAAGTEFGRPLVNSRFTMALVVGISVPELTLGTIVAQLGVSDAAFPAPVFQGDTIRVAIEVISARESKSRPDAG